MNNLKNSNILKAICYTAIPILLIIIIVNTASIAILVNNPNEIKQGIGYFETKRFRNQYLSELVSCSTVALRNYGVEYNTQKESNEDLIIDEEAKKEAIEEKEGTEGESNVTVELKVYREEYIAKALKDEENYSKDNEIIIDYSKIQHYSDNYDILIIKDGIAYTNIEKTTKTDTIGKLIDYIKNKQYNWSYSENEISTDISTMQYDEIAYNSYFTSIQEKGIEIYSSVRDTNSNQFIVGRTMYNMVSKTHVNAPVSILFSGIILLLIMAYLVVSIGHKKNHEGIYVDWIDKIPLEILFIIASIALTIEGIMFGQFMNLLQEFFTTGISLLLLMGLVIYITTAIFLVSLIRRIKAKVFFKHTLCYKIAKYFYKKAKEIKNIVLSHININLKIIAFIVGALIISMIIMLLALESYNFFFFFVVLIVFWAYLITRIIKYASKMYELRETIKHIYNGNNNTKLNEEEFNGELKEVAVELNDISGGLSNAIEESLKSERMKTDLITNVSHDIKTPLTSIINYVDLLKKEDIQNETAREYLQILDNKSQRLKKLTEDLIEASKASSGNIKLNIEKLNLGELLKQIRGEFEDKFNKRGLEIIENIPKEIVYINADSKYMYRVMENLYTNISKYALENSRVYVDLLVSGKADNKKSYIILKNISQDKLNISAEELMQRFVRGDSSRTTTGSGLGLSIAKSLIELQNGKFEMHLDGDLFKVVIEF